MSDLINNILDELEKSEREREEQAKIFKELLEADTAEEESILKYLKLIANGQRGIISQNEQIIKLLEKPEEGDTLEETLKKVLEPLFQRLESVTNQPMPEEPVKRKSNSFIPTEEQLREHKKALDL